MASDARSGPLRVAVLASGTGSNLAALLRAIQGGLVDARVGLVVSDRPGAGCLDIATEAGVAALALPPEGDRREAYDARLAEALEAESPDLIVLAGFMRILSADFVRRFEGRIVNLHPSLLPAFPGAHGIRDALAAGARVTGCTTHFVTPDLDAGPIILQAALAIRPGEAEPELANRVHAVEHQILPRTIQLIAEGRVQCEGGRVVIREGPSWVGHVDALPGVLYPEAY